MSFESIPSKALNFFDIPEVNSLSVSFSYNFFTTDEKVDETGNEALNGNLSERFLKKGTADTTNLNARIPRYVQLSFSLSDSKKKMMGNRSTSNLLKATKEEIIEALNSGMVATEDDVSTGRFKSVIAGNQSIEDDLDKLLRLTLNRYVASVEESSVQDAINRFSPNTKIGSSFMSSRMVPPSLNERPDGKLFSDFMTEQKKIKSAVQLNSSYAPSILRRSIDSGNSLSRDLLFSRFFDYSNSSSEPTDMLISEDEGVFDIPAVDIEKSDDIFVPEASIVGVILEKNRVYKGKRYPMPVVVTTGKNPTTAYDSQVAYGQTYEYIATTLAKVRIPVTSDDGRTYAQTLFIASKPSSPVQVTIEEDRAPEPPQDINYHFDYSSESLYLTWAPPINPQRDVKYIQVYRRKTLDEPFQLIANLDFDDSIIRNKTKEDIDEGLTISFSSMPTYFIDSDFGRESSYIYSLVSVDARQISSTYSTQVKVSFDSQKNKVKKELISYAGAPKQYPNWMIKENFFVDSMKDSSHGKVDIYFNPEAYTVVRGSGETFPAFYSTTIDPLSKYVFQFMNTDRLLEKKLELRIDDTAYQSILKTSQVGGEDDDE